MVGWRHQLNGHEFEQTPGDSEGQGSLACCSPWGCKELDMTEQLTHTHRIKILIVWRISSLFRWLKHLLGWLLKTQSLCLCARQDLSHYENKVYAKYLIPGSKAILKPNNSNILIKQEVWHSVLVIWCEQTTHWKSPWCWERSRAEGEEGIRGWDGWMASLMQWIWTWANF